MAGVNKVILLGRLGKDPELKTFENGNKLCNFSIATSEYYQDKEGSRQERTEWHNIVMFNKLADLAVQYLSKGREVYLEGKLQTRSYQDANNVTKYTTEIVGTTLNFIGGNKTEGNNSASNSNTASSSNNIVQAESVMPQNMILTQDDTDDLPF
jgi:single-strand DNA-binding protein